MLSAIPLESELGLLGAIVLICDDLGILKISTIES